MKVVPVLVFSLTALTACAGDVKAPTREHFADAISAKLSKDNAALCIQAPAVPARMYAKGAAMDIGFQVDGEQPRLYDDRIYSQYVALEHAGLINEQRVVVTARRARLYSIPAATKTVAIERFTPTARWAQYSPAQAHSDSFLGVQDLCYGHVVVDHITNWTEPGDAFGMRATTVTFIEKPESVADWAKDASIRVAFPEVTKLDTLGTTEQHMTLILTANGWQASP